MNVRDTTNEGDKPGAGFGDGMIYHPALTEPATERAGALDVQAWDEPAARDQRPWADQPGGPGAVAPSASAGRVGQATWGGAQSPHQPRAAGGSTMTAEQLQTALQDIAALRSAVHTQVGGRVFGMDEAIDLLLIALLSGLHVLIEGDGGLGKTSLIKAFAQSLGLSASRIQFTADLLPADLTGTSLPSWIGTGTAQGGQGSQGGSYGAGTPGRSPLEFRRGPLFAHIVHADELNRAPGQTQSGLIEAMEEGQITVDRQTYRLPDPFLVLATQNPLDELGTHALPRNILDRFGLSYRPAFPDEALLARIISEAPRLSRHPLASVFQAAPAEAVVASLRDAVAHVRYTPDIVYYMVELIRTFNMAHVRSDEFSSGELAEGPSPRAGAQWLMACQARAALQRRADVRPEDVKALAIPLLAHRLIAVDYNATRDDLEELIALVLENTPAPSAQPGARHRVGEGVARPRGRQG